MAYIARMFIGAGGCWQRAETKDEAVRLCVRRAIEDWSSLYDMKRALKEKALKVSIYEDGGTDSFDDDTYLETVTP
jgi:hypothetical protein